MAWINDRRNTHDEDPILQKARCDQRPGTKVGKDQTGHITLVHYAQWYSIYRNPRLYPQHYSKQTNQKTINHLRKHVDSKGTKRTLSAFPSFLQMIDGGEPYTVTSTKANLLPGARRTSVSSYVPYCLPYSQTPTALSLHNIQVCVLG